MSKRLPCVNRRWERIIPKPGRLVSVSAHSSRPWDSTSKQHSWRWFNRDKSRTTTSKRKPEERGCALFRRQVRGDLLKECATVSFKAASRRSSSASEGEINNLFASRMIYLVASCASDAGLALFRTASFAPTPAISHR